ncbi:hypothetical protein FQA39_LY00883 [Lamprigera yunnana]|nr:hypothetical protein FQA39_LY00883 [Lamprigera yunnana]
MFNTKLKKPNNVSSTIVAWLAGFYCLVCFGPTAMLTLYENELFSGEPWVLSVFSICLGILIIILVIIVIQPKSSNKLSFAVPFVPWLPAISIFVNIYLMTTLDPATWIRFVVWICIGLIIYFSYGIWNSKEIAQKRKSINSIRSDSSQTKSIILNEISVMCNHPPPETFLAIETKLSIEYVKVELLKLIKQFETEMTVNPHKQKDHEAKMESALSRLEDLDNKLLKIYNVFKPDEDDDLVSSFGLSIKLDMAKDRLNNLKAKHSNMCREWHCQDDHMNKTSKKISEKENHLKTLNTLCTVQGLILGKLLWKFSNTTKLLEAIVSNHKLLLELIRLYNGSLYSFVHTFGKHLANTVSEEYEFVLSLTGIFNNVGTIPDGRFFLLHYPLCQEVINYIIRIIPNIRDSNCQDLKFLLLSSIYNIMICKEGEDFVRKNGFLTNTLRDCLNTFNSERITLLGIKIVSCFLEDSQFFRTVGVLVKQLQDLHQHTNSTKVQNDVSEIISYLKIPRPKSIVEICEQPLIKSKKATKRQKLRNEKEYLAYYVYSEDTLNPFNPNFHTKRANLNITTSCSHIFESSSSFPNHSRVYNFRSVPTCGNSKTKIKYPSKTVLTTDVATCAGTSGNSTIKSWKDMRAPVHTNSNYRNESEEMQIMQYQYSDTNLRSTCSVNIGDNFKNVRTGSSRYLTVSNHTDGEKLNASTVTVYRINSPQTYSSDNLIFSLLRSPLNDVKTLRDEEKMVNVTPALTDINQLVIEQNLEQIRNLPSTSNPCKYIENIGGSSSSNTDIDKQKHLGKFRKRYFRHRKSRPYKKRCKQVKVTYNVFYRGKKQ